jgi:hypothetical protein
MALEVNWQARRRLRFPSRATLRHPDYHPQVERKVALRMQARVALGELIESRSNHGGSNSLSEWGVSDESAAYVTITCILNSSSEIANSNWAKLIHWSTDAVPHLFDDSHVGLQSSRWILVSPCHAALRRHGGIEWSEHDILVLELL